MWCRAGKCCFCINQRVGVIIIACILLVWDFLVVFCTSSMVVFYAVEVYPQEVLNGEDRDGDASRETGISWTVLINPALSILDFLLDIMLLAAAITARHKLLHGWLVTYAVVYILSLLTFWLNRDVFFRDSSGLFILLPGVLVVYFWIEVLSYYLQLRQKCDDGGHQSAGSKVNWLVPTGGALPAQGTFWKAPGKGMVPTTPPHHISSEEMALCHSHSDTKAPSGVC